MTHRAHCDVWISSCTEEGGAYRYRLDTDTEKLSLAQVIPMPSPMWLEVRGQVLWAVLRAPFEGREDSAIASYDVDRGRQLSLESTRGVVACHMAIDGEDIYAANYVTGSLIRLPGVLAEHEGKGVDPERQASPHVHSVFFSPDKRYLLSCDLGLDKVFVYDRELREVSTSSVPAGAGPRHLVFSRDGQYVYTVNEMGGSVSVFGYGKGRLTYRHTVPLMRGQEKGMGAAIRLSPDGHFLYVSERKDDQIVTLRADGASLTEIARCDCHGDGPRDFALIADGRYAVAANQWSGNIALFRVEEDYTLTWLQNESLPQAISVAEA